MVTGLFEIVMERWVGDLSFCVANGGKNAPVDGVSIEPVSVLIPLTRLSAHPTRDKVFLLRAVASMNLGNEAYTTARSGGPTAVRSHHHTDSHSTTALLVQLVANTCRPTIFGDDPAP